MIRVPENNINVQVLWHTHKKNTIKLKQTRSLYIFSKKMLNQIINYVVTYPTL